MDQLRSSARAGNHCILVGPRGTAKTTSVRRLVREVGRPLFRIQGHADLMVDELRGQTGLRAGETVFVPGVVTRAIKEAGWLLFDEVNLCRPAVPAWLNDVLDEEGVLCIPETGEQLDVPSEFQAFFAYNVGYAGTREVNEALKDRCRVIWCDYWPADVEFNVIKGRLETLRRRFERESRFACADVDIRRVIRVANAIREARRKGSIDFDFSVRTAVQWLIDALDLTQDLLESFSRVVLPKVGDPLQDAPQHQALLEIARLALDAKTP